MEKCYFDNDTLMRVVITEDGDVAEPVEDITLVAAPDREVYVQVGEIECWSGGTRGAMEMFCDKYKEFSGQLFVNGDATGNSERSSSTTTDWRIVSDYLTNAGFDFSLQPGLVPTYPKGFKGGDIKYNNPPRKDTFNITNLLLRDQSGKVHIVFMPESEYESGGAANSVGSMETNPDGMWNESCDKKEGRDVPRTHFTDTVRYFAWLVTGGNILVLSDTEANVADILAERQKARARVQLGTKRNKLTNTPNRPQPGFASGSRKRTGSLVF
jgi:hypothetical protein